MSLHRIPDDDVLAAFAGVPVLMLGATGFIGRRVVAALAARGAIVTASGRDAARLATIRERTGAQAMPCDITRVDDVVRLVQRARPAVTFNLAGYGVDRSQRDERTAHQINAELPAHLAQALHAEGGASWPGLALVHAGSALEYGTAAGDLREDTPPTPTTLYGRSKLDGTEAIATHCRATGLRGCTARLFTVYGPGEAAGRLLPSLLEAARTNSALSLTAGLQRRDFTFVDDVAEGMLRLALATPEPGEIVNLATGTLKTVRDFALRAARVLDLDAALLRFGEVPTRTEEMSHEPVAIERLRALTGWAPHTVIEDGVLRTLNETKQRYVSV